MKKLTFFLFILFIICAVLPSSAQIRFGVMGGLNLTSFDFDPLEEWIELKNRTVFGFGCVFDCCLKRSISLLVEPMYLQKGTKLEIVGAGVQFGAEYKLSYFELPVMLKYSIGSGNINPYVMAGTAFGFNLSSKVKVTRGENSYEKDYKDKIKSIDLGVSFGRGVSILLGNNSIFVEARYAPGLTNISEDPDDPDTEIKTKGVQIFTGITFPMGK